MTLAVLLDFFHQTLKVLIDFGFAVLLKLRDCLFASFVLLEQTHHRSLHRTIPFTHEGVKFDAF